MGKDRAHNDRACDRVGQSRAVRPDQWLQALIRASAIVFALPVACAGDEFQYRLNGAVAFDLAEKWKGTVGAESRYDDRGSQVKHHSDFGVVYTGLTDWLDVGINYRNIFKQLEDDQWRRENRGYLNFLIRHRVYDIGLKHRIRLEYNHWESIRDFGTLRYRIGINPPFEIDPSRERLIVRNYKLRPYGSYELAVNTLDDRIASHSVKGGLSISLTEKIIGNVYYMREEYLSAIDDRDVNVIGLDMKLLF